MSDEKLKEFVMDIKAMLCSGNFNQVSGPRSRKEFIAYKEGMYHVIYALERIMNDESR